MQRKLTSEKIKTAFQKRLEILMILNDMSNEELAKKLGIDKSSVSNYKAVTGRTPSLETIIKMADIFDVSIDFLIGRNGGFVINDGRKMNESEHIETNLLDNAIKINSYCKSRIENKEGCGDCPFDDGASCKIMERPDLWEV